MTTSDYRKVFKQLKVKPAKLAKYKKHNKPKKRSTGISLRKCKRCGRQGGHVSKYNLHLCRHCFREIAEKLGFERFS